MAWLKALDWDSVLSTCKPRPSANSWKPLERNAGKLGGLNDFGTRNLQQAAVDGVGDGFLLHGAIDNDPGRSRPLLHWPSLKTGERRDFGENTKIYLYPSVGSKSGKVLFPNDLPLPEDVKHLLSYLEMNRRIVKLENANTAFQYITSEKVIELIEQASPELCDFIHPKVEQIIKEKQLFGYGIKKK